MRRINSSFLTNFNSRAGAEQENGTYYGFVELEDYYCLAVAEAIDPEAGAESAKLCVDMVISLFTDNPTMKPWKLKRYVKKAHEELKQHSVKKQMKASLLVVVSDYTRVRYVQCGNIMFYLLRNGRFVLKSGTHTVYQRMRDNQAIPEDGVTGIEQASNLTSFLGSKERVAVAVSQKAALKEEDLILLGTHAFWAHVCPVEILDAEEGRKDGAEFLERLEEVLQGGQEEKLSSYCLAAVEIKKVYFEDQAGKKKVIKRILILTLVILLIAAVVITVSVYMSRRNRRNQQEIGSRIVNYGSSGDLYFGAESYEAAVKQYEKALDEVPKLQDEGRKMDLEQEFLQKISMITDLQKAETAISGGDYKLARKTLIKVKGLLKEYPDLGLDYMVSKNLSTVNRQIEILNLKDYAKLVEGAKDYGRALETYERIYEMQRILEDFDGMKETRLAIFDLEQLTTEDQQTRESEQEAVKEAENQQKVAEAKGKGKSAEQAVIDGNLPKAIEIYRGMREELLALGADEEAGRIYETMLALEEEQKKQESEKKEKELEEEIKKIDAKKILAEQALLEGKVEEAKQIYREMSDSYIECGEIEKASEIYQILLGL